MQAAKGFLEGILFLLIGPHLCSILCSFLFGAERPPGPERSTSAVRKGERRDGQRLGGPDPVPREPGSLARGWAHRCEGDLCDVLGLGHLVGNAKEEMRKRKVLLVVQSMPPIKCLLLLIVWLTPWSTSQKGAPFLFCNRLTRRMLFWLSHV